MSVKDQMIPRDNDRTVKHLRFTVAKRRRQIANKSRMFNFKKAKEAK
jgi:hypothetical protein